MLEAKKVHVSHISDAISAAIKEMLDQFHIPLNKVQVILMDNASNMKKAMDNIGVWSLGCFAHTLQLVVNEGLLSQRSVFNAIAIGRQIVGRKQKKTTLLQVVNKRFDTVEDEPLYGLATLLDLRHKDR